MSSKHKILTEEEFGQFSINKRILHYLQLYAQNSRLNKEEINVLDWGCGRGRSVLWLREKGYSAYGVDIDNKPIQNGQPLLMEKGYDPNVLRMLTPSAKTDFSDNFFHFIFSEQVLEHIENLEAVAEEIHRVSQKKGVGFHIYPAQKYIVEGHLFMPFIHWLPKNRMRRILIAFYVLLGKEPRWTELKEKDFQERVDTYFQYSINKTFYRKFKDVKKIFSNEGFDVSCETIHHPKVVQHRIIGKLLKNKLLSRFVDFMLTTYRTVELRIVKR